MSDTALRLADELDHGIGTIDRARHEAAAELRRLHAEHIELGKALARAIERNNELEAELAEQARLVGMGSEREAKLLAVNAELVGALRRVRGTGVFLGAIAQEMVDAALAKVEASK